MLENVITKLLKDYLTDYLDNFDQNMLNINLFGGEIKLQNLQLNNKILDNVPMPLKLKYGRIGLIRLELPKVWQLAAMSSMKIRVVVEDVFICLETRPMPEWNDNAIVDAFHAAKQAMLDKYEDESRFFYIEQKGDEEQMNKFVLSIIQNIQVDINRIYLRIEDPYPFALGLLIPSITVRTCDANWTQHELLKSEEPEIAYKNARVKDFSIFMERDLGEVNINEIIDLEGIKNLKDFEQIREQRIYEHIRKMFGEVQSEVENSVVENQFNVNPNDFLIKGLTIDTRLQLTIDKVAVQKNRPTDKQPPDMKIHIMFGGTFEQATTQNVAQNQALIQIREDQINAVTQFTAVSAIYSTYQLGILKTYFEQIFLPDSKEIQEYIQNYEEYQRLKIKGDEDEKMEAVKVELRSVERKYRADIMFLLRKAINERYYGLRNADHFIKEQEHNLNPQHNQEEGSEQRQGFFSRLIFGRRSHNQPQSDLTDEEKSAKLRQSKFVAAFLRMFYKSRFKKHLEEIAEVSKDKFDPAQAILPPQENSTFELDFEIKKLSLQLFSSKEQQSTSHRQLLRQGTAIVQPNLLFNLVIEGLLLNMFTEVKPEYLKLQIYLQNFYIRDYHSPNPNLPYVIQTIIPQHSIKQFYGHQALQTTEQDALITKLNASFMQKVSHQNAIEISYEVNPKLPPAKTSVAAPVSGVSQQSFHVSNQKLRCYTKGELYIYANLQFGKTMVEFTQRVLAKMEESYATIVSMCPPQVFNEISSGSTYQKKLEQMIANKRDQLEKNLVQYQRGNYESPKLDLDISFNAPKLVLHESLMHSFVIDPDRQVALVIDLGKIEAKTKLVQKLKNVDYGQEMNSSLLYDIITVNFSKLKITADYNLKFNLNPSNQDLSWTHSKMKLDITNNINFGFQYKLNIAKYHQMYPAQVLNAKFEDFELKPSRHFLKSVFKLMAIYENCEFNQALNVFINQPSKDVVSEELKHRQQPIQISQQDDDIIYETARTKQNQQYPVINQQLIDPVLLRQQQIPEEVKQPELLFPNQEQPNEQEPSVAQAEKESQQMVTFELNFIFNKLAIQLEEVKKSKRQSAASFGRASPHLIQEAEEDEPYYYVKTILEFNIEGLMGRVNLDPGKELTECQVFLRHFYIVNKSSDFRYKHLIHNPYADVEDQVRMATPATISKISQQYLGDSQAFFGSHLGKQSGSKLKPANAVDFDVFKLFNPEVEQESYANQIKVKFVMVGNDMNVKVDIVQFTLYFLIPELRMLLTTQADVQIDQVVITGKIKDKMAFMSKKQNRTSLIDTEQNPLQQQSTKKKTPLKKNLRKMGYYDKSPTGLKKTFTMKKKYHEGGMAGALGRKTQKLKLGKGGKLAVMAKEIKVYEKAKKEETERIKKEKIAQMGIKEVLAKKKMSILVNVQQIQVVIPTNLYENSAPVFKVGLKCDFRMESDSLVKEFRTKDPSAELIDQLTLKELTSMFVGLNQLEIFTEEQSLEMGSQSLLQDRLYFLKPYNLKIDIKTLLTQRSKQDSDSKTHINVKGTKFFELQLGLREIQTYLLLGQVYFSFMNDITFVTQHNDWRAKKKIQDAVDKMKKWIEKQQKNKFRVALNLSPKDSEDFDQEEAREEEKEQEDEMKQMTLDDIIDSEGLGERKEMSKAVKLWQRAFAKIQALKKDRKLSKSRIMVHLKGFKFSIVDNSESPSSQVALVSFSIDQLKVQTSSCQYDRLKAQLMEKWFKMDQISNNFFFLKLNFYLYGSYYNRNTFADEPFIESFPLQVFIKQQSPLSEVVQIISSKQMLNINFTYGLFCNIQRAMVNLLKLEEESNEVIPSLFKQNFNGINEIGANEEVKESIPIQEEQDEEMIIMDYRKKQISHMLKDSRIVKRIDDQRVAQFAECSVQSMSDSSDDMVGESQTVENDDINEITEIQLLNKTGLELKLCLSNLCIDLMQDQTQPKPRLANESLFNRLTPEDKVIVLAAQGGIEVMPIHYLEEIMKQYKQETLQKNRALIKVDFKIQGFKQIKNVILQKNGIFGYSLLNQNRRKRDLVTGEKTSLSCIVRVQRVNQFIKVYFESGMVMLNDTQFDLDLFAVENVKPIQRHSEFTIRSKKVYKPPLNWFINDTAIYKRYESAQEISMEIFHNLSQVCDPRIIDPYKDYSKIVKVEKHKQISADVYFLKTKTTIGQFLIAFHPLVMITNLLFNDVQISTPYGDQEVRHVKTNTSQYLYDVNPYDSQGNRIDIAYRESDTKEYISKEGRLDLHKLQTNVVVGYQQGYFMDLIIKDPRDQSVQQTIYIAVEKLQETRQLRNTKYNDFALRGRYYYRTKCVEYQFYFPYVVVNKTPLDITMIGYDLNMTVNDFTNVIIKPTNPKLQLEVPTYKRSKPFEINTYGVSGFVTVKRQKHHKGKALDQNNIMDPSLDPKNQNELEIGTYFSICHHPYSKTKLIKFLPKYIIINKLDDPIVLKEKNSHHQIALMPNEEIYFNSGHDEDDKMMIRLLNFEKETRELQQDISMLGKDHIFSQPIDINNIPSQSRSDIRNEEPVRLPNEDDHNIEEHKQLDVSSIILTQGHQGGLALKEISQLSPEFGLTEDIKTWSYYFQLSKVDDFQITIPNPNLLNKEYKQGWQTTEDKLFVRVNISPGPDNDATLYISFTQPYYPEYIFYNQLKWTVKVQHQSQAIKNEEYYIGPNQKEAIVLNPNDKDQDYLIVEVLDDTQRPIDKFKYEIDSLSLHQQGKQGSNYHIVTKMSGNLRFIHLQIEDQPHHHHSDEEEEEGGSEEGNQSWIEQALEKLNEEDFDDELDSSIGSHLSSQEEFDNDQDDIMLMRNNNQRQFYYQQRRTSTNQNLLGDEQMNQRERRIQNMNDQASKGDVIGDIANQKSVQLISLAGLGISLVNSDPKEITYLSLTDIELLLFIALMKKEDIERTRTRLNFSIMNFQIDNMTMKSFPVIIGPRKAFNLKEKYVRQGESLRNELHQKEIAPLSKSEERVDFIQFYLDNITTMEGKISSQRIKKLDFACQEINICFHQHSMNNLLQYTSSLVDLISDELLQDFLKSETLYSYDHMMLIMKMEDEFSIERIRKKSYEQMGRAYDQSQMQEYIHAREHERDKKHQKNIQKLQGAIGFKPVIDEEEEKEEDEEIQSQGPLLHIFEHQALLKAQMNQVKTKEDICKDLKPDRIRFQQSEGFDDGKILVQEISIKALRLYLTFRIQQLESALGVQGGTQAMLNFFANFTNVSDASIYFTQIDISNSYTTMANITNIMTKHYLTQGIQQFYKILGATDIVGNPVGLISNLGRGVEELYSEPLQGALSGDVSKAAIGIGRGVLGFTTQVGYALSNSLSKMTGTWYMGIKNLSGYTNTDESLDNPINIPRGIWQGTKSLGFEIVQGVAGVVTVPKKRVREQGLGCSSVTKGTFQGVFGLVTCPITGTLKMINSFSTGIKNQTGNEKPLTRIRYPRYFDDKEIMLEYNRVLSHAYTALRTIEEGEYKNEVILFAYDISGYVDNKMERFRDMVFVCTDRQVLYIRDMTKIKLQLRLKDIFDVSVVLKDPKTGKPDTSKIIFTTNQARIHTVVTQKPKTNAAFVQQLRTILQLIQKQMQPSQKATILIEDFEQPHMIKQTSSLVVNLPQQDVRLVDQRMLLSVDPAQ